MTAGQVLMSWHQLQGADAGTAIVRRGERACPHTPAEGSPAGPVTSLHIIDRTVQAGTAYCYTLFSKAVGGSVRTIASSGLVTVPNPGVVPPASAPAPAPAPRVAVSSLTPARKRMLTFSAAGILAILLVVLALVASARFGAGGAVVHRTAREWILARPSAAVVVPALIALGWVCLVIGFVVLQ